MFSDGKIFVVKKWSSDTISEYTGGKILLNAELFKGSQDLWVSIATALVHEYTHSQQNFAMRTRFYLVDSEREALLAEDGFLSDLGWALKKKYAGAPARGQLNLQILLSAIQSNNNNINAQLDQLSGK